ncbi:molybdate ABC transporter substrate-binding protein [Cohnella sp. GCM10027633]|uniref:molybdate ABC transporter substrate-binding protein n=1 Tax=unclassified Cohnella TaxID=2636738 RepID=UPI00362D0BA3
MLSLAAACGNESNNAAGEPVQLTISAAASLKDALTEIQGKYEATHDRVKLSFNFAASGALQQQIEQGAPVDLFLSAAAKNMDALVDKGLIEEDMHANLLSNELVVVTPTDGNVLANIADLSKDEIKQIAIGIPASVPAGSYAQEALTNAGIWDELQSKTVQAKDVRQVLQYVETGNVDAGFVYKTDALTSDKVNVAFAVDPATYKPIVYTIGLVKATEHRQEAEDAYEYLQSEEAVAIFQKYGFTLPSGD